MSSQIWIYGQSSLTKALFAFVLACSCAAGLLAASTPAQAKAKAVTRSADSLDAVLKEVTKARKHVEAALDSLNSLSSGGASDLTKDYKRFSKRVTRLAETAETVRRRAQDMQQRREAYLAEWQKKTASVNDPDIQAHMANRAEQVRVILDSSQPAREAARDAFRPLLSNLQDIDKLLSVDLSPSGVAAAAPITESAVVNGNVVLQRLDAVISALTRVRDELSPRRRRR